jgi:hypothetical protein
MRSEALCLSCCDCLKSDALQLLLLFPGHMLYSDLRPECTMAREMEKLLRKHRRRTVRQLVCTQLE